MDSDKTQKISREAKRVQARKDFKSTWSKQRRMPVTDEADADFKYLLKRLFKLGDQMGIVQYDPDTRFWREQIVDACSRNFIDEEEAKNLLAVFDQQSHRLKHSKIFAEWCSTMTKQFMAGQYLQLDKRAVEERDRKRLNRVGFIIRVQNTLPPGVKHLSQIALTLDLLQDIGKSAVERLDSYGSKHKCPHGRHWNKYGIVKRRFLVPDCDHHCERLSPVHEDVSCSRCGSSDIEFVERPCEHVGYACKRCRRTYYHVNGEISSLTCDCDVELILTNERALADMREFLDRNVRKRVSTSPTSYAGAIAGPTSPKRISIKRFLSDSSDIPTVEHHGAVQSLAATAKSTAKNAVAAVLEKLSDFGKVILDWMRKCSTETFYRENPLFCEFLSIIGLILESVGSMIAERTPLDFALLAAAFCGGTKVVCATSVILLAELVSKVLVRQKGWQLPEFLTSSVETILTSWNDGKKLPVAQARVEMYKNFSARFATPDRFKMALKGNLKDSLNEEEAAAILELVELDEGDLISFRMLAEEPPAVSHHGFWDMLSMISLAFPFKMQGPVLKTISSFCKEIVPIITVGKLLATLTSCFTKWVYRVLGYFTGSTRDWLEYECHQESSPVRSLLLEATQYRFAATSDDPRAKEHYAEALRLRKEATDYIIAEKRYDAVSLRFLSDADRLLSSNPMPPSSRKHEPFCVRLYGAPGTGKSRSVPVLFGPLMGTKNTKEFYSKTFARNSQEYWDGVGPRQCILYDDFGQNRTEPVDLMELILLVSAAPFMANMANIAGGTPKGISLDPKIVVACSNIGQDVSNHITDLEAISRRFHLKIHTTKGDDGKPRFEVTGGSLTDADRGLVPKTGPLTLLEAQRFIYESYRVFLNDRALGLLEVDELASTELPPLMHFNASGEADVVYSYKKEEAQSYFSRFDAPTIKYNRVAPVPTVEHQAGISWSALLDVFLTETSANYLGWLVGVNIIASWNFMSGHFTINNWKSKLLSILLPALTGLASTLIIYLHWRRTTVDDVEQHSSRAKGKEAVRTVVAQGGQAVTSIQNMLEKSTCRITCENGMRVHGILIAETYFLTVEHLFVPLSGSNMYVPEGTKYKLYVPNMDNPVEFTFERKRMRVLKKNVDGVSCPIDVVVYELPRCIPMFRNIIKKFWDASHLLRDTPGLLLKHSASGRSFSWLETTLNSQAKVRYSQAGKEWVQNLAHASHPGEAGMCGSPVMLATGDTDSPIVGMHIAGSPDGNHHSMVMLLTPEIILEACPRLYALQPPSLESEHTDPVEVPHHCELLTDTSLLAVGKLKRPMFEPTRTTLEKSIIFDKVVPHRTEPSVLSNMDPRIPDHLKGIVDLYRDGIRKMAKPMDLSYEQLFSVRSDMIEWYTGRAKALGMHYRKPYRLVECLNTTTLKSMDMSTSPGYPFVMKNLRRIDLFEVHADGKRLAKEGFLHQLFLDLEWIKSGTVPQWFLMTALKDERRPIEKVRVKPKTRLFTVCPLVYILLEKMYSAPFMEAVLAIPDAPYAGGVDRLGISWHSMFTRLREKSDRGFGGDYECFDGRISQGLMDSAHEIIASVLDENSLDTRFQILSDEICQTRDAEHYRAKINALNLTHREVMSAVHQAGSNPVYLMKNFAFQASGTLASGRWATQLVGTLVGEMLQRAAWNQLVPPAVRGGASFKKYVANSIMSDDNINAVCDSALDYFNADTFSAWLLERGMVYTSADKKGTAKRFEPLEQISFLKNTTGLLKGFYCPLMEFDAAVEQINWVRKSKYNTPKEALQMNADSALRAVFFHGPDRFSAIRNGILEHCPDLDLPSYNVLMEIYLNYGYFPGHQTGESSYWDQIGEIPRTADLIDLSFPLEETPMIHLPLPTLVETVEVPSDAQNTMDIKTVQHHSLIRHCFECDLEFGSVNRYIDHLFAKHQDLETWKSAKTWDAMVATAPVGVLRLWASDISACTESNPETVLLKNAVQAQNHSLKDIFPVIINLISLPRADSFSNTKREHSKILQKTNFDMEKFNYGFPQHDPVPMVQHHSGVDTTSNVELVENPIATSVDPDKTLKEPTEEERQVDQRFGTILADKGPRDMVSTIRAQTLTFTAPRAESHLNELAWTLESMLSKWHLVNTIPWPVSASVGTILFDGDVVKDLLQTTFASAPFNSFKYFRCAGVKIKVVVVGSKFHQGRAVVGFYPTMVPKVTLAHPRYPPNGKMLIEGGAVVCDPSQGGETEFYIPFRHPKGWLELEADDALGQLVTVVHSPLVVADAGSQQVQIKIFFCLDSPSFKTPRAQAVTKQQMDTFLRNAKRNERPVVPKFVLAPNPAAKEKIPFVQHHAGNVPVAVKMDPGQVGINEWTREGQPIATARAKTADARTSHFGEMETNLMNYGKRYRLVANFRGTSTSKIWRWTVSMSDVLNSFWMLKYFVLLRGAINFKIYFKVDQYENCVCSAFYEPQPSTLNEALYRTAILSQHNNSARSVSNGNEALEFQVPFLAPSATVLNPWFYKNTVQSTFQYLPSGKLFIEATHTNNAEKIGTFYVYAALSDEFGAGVFRAVPTYFLDVALPFGDQPNRDDDDFQHVPVVQHQGLFDDVAKGVLSELKKVADDIVPEQVVSTALSMLDKPAISVPPTFVIAKNGGFLNFVSGPEAIDRFSLYPGRQQLVDEEHFGVKGNDADLRSLFQRPSYIGELTWSVDDAPGTLLTRISVGPTLEFDVGGITPGFSPSIMCSIAKNFKYWRGGITFIFDVVCTNFHEGKLDVTFHPNSGVVPADYNARLSQYTVSTTIRNTENRFAITAPYLGEEPWKIVHLNQPSNEPSAVSSPPAFSRYFSGTLALTVGAPLRVPDTVPPKVAILVYVLPASDFEVVEPTMDSLGMREQTEIF